MINLRLFLKIVRWWSTLVVYVILHIVITWLMINEWRIIVLVLKIRIWLLLVKLCIVGILLLIWHKWLCFFKLSHFFYRFFFIDFFRILFYILTFLLFFHILFIILIITAEYASDKVKYSFLRFRILDLRLCGKNFTQLMCFYLFNWVYCGIDPHGISLVIK